MRLVEQKSTYIDLVWIVYVCALFSIYKAVISI